LEYAESLLPGEDIASVSDALRISECRPANAPGPRTFAKTPGLHVPAESDVFVSTTGKAAGKGTISDPFDSLHSARDWIRTQRDQAAGSAPQAYTVQIRSGTYYLPSTLELTPRDSNITFQSYQDEDVTLSGGTHLQLQLGEIPAQQRESDPQVAELHSRGVLSAPLPAGVAVDFETLFVLPGAADSHSTLRAQLVAQRRLPWAREPSGDAERDLQPTGYALVNGGAGARWPATEGAEYMSVEEPARNCSTYPVHGRPAEGSQGARRGFAEGSQRLLRLPASG
jgi:hypothetical protein